MSCNTPTADPRTTRETAFPAHSLAPRINLAGPWLAGHGYAGPGAPFQTSTVSSQQAVIGPLGASLAHETALGERRAEFDRLYFRTCRRARMLAGRMLPNPADADEVTQDAYLRAWRHFDRYDRARPFENWLMRIVTNLALDRQRHNRQAVVCSLDAPDVGGVDSSGVGLLLADPAAQPDVSTLRKAFCEPLQEALQSLPREHRTAVLLVDVYDLSYAEAAEVAGCPVGTIRSRLHRGRQLLREFVTRRWPAWSSAEQAGRALSLA